ncbi:MAG TPA: hypothetical protein VGA70_04680 [Longimicrobiales bacterium]
MAWSLFWIVLGTLALAGWSRRRFRPGSGRSDGPALDDDAIRRIVEEGVIRADGEEPLDLEEIEEEERRFWEEDWEETEEW